MKRSILVLVIFSAAMAGFALGKQEKMEAATAPAEFATEALSPDQLAEIMAQEDKNTILIDVRTSEEYNSGAIPAAINIPYDVIQDNLPTQDRNARIIVYCRSGSRSRIAKQKLDALGFRYVNNFGGVYNWQGELVVRE